MDYKQFVESMASAGENNLFLNSGPIHAAIVMSRIFKHAKARGHIEIYSGGFSGAVSNDEDYLKYLDQFLKKGGELNILVTEDQSSNPNSKIFSVLQKHPANVRMRLAADRVVQSETNKPVHFTIGDGKMMRLETGIDDYTAQVNFNDPEFCGNLSELFYRIWDKSQHQPITLA